MKRAYKKRTFIQKTAYEKSIAKLFPFADHEASIKVAESGRRTEMRTGADGLPYEHCLWTEFFHAAMARMGREEGLRS